MNIASRCLSAAALALLLSSTAAAEFMSVSPERANVREGPGTDYDVLWEAWRFTPFEVLEWSDEWAKIKDFEGDVGWAHQSVLSELPCVIVAGKHANVRDGPGLDYGLLWTVDRGYPFNVLGADGDWLRLSDGDGLEGWMFRKLLWGNVDPGAGGA